MDATAKEKFIAKRMAKAEKDWEKRGRMGRPSHYEANKNAIVKLVEVNAGVSDPEFGQWTLSKWVKEVGTYRGILNPRPATIKKTLKELFSRNLIPLHLMPAKLIQAMPREARLDYLLALAISKALFKATKTGITKVSFSTINEIHQRLCEEHLWKMKRLPEAQRREWCEKKLKGVVQVPLESRKPMPVLQQRNR